jgi:carboxypeptidase C (cathepsin A)
MLLKRKHFCSAVFAPCLFCIATMHVDAAVADEGQVVVRETASQSAPREFATTQTFKSGGKEFHYKALAGEIFLRGDDAKPTASIFSTSYFKENIDEPNRRPIMFLFNGGPGSTSVWLHLAAFGPKRIDLPEPYEVFSIKANKAWKRSKDGNKVFSGYLNTTQYLAQAAANNPGFRIFVASGYHDLTTTFFGAKHIFEHSGINSKQVTLRNYDGGHMMYLHQPSRQQLSADIAEFVESAVEL